MQKNKRLLFWERLACILALLMFSSSALAGVDTSPPTSPVKLIFIHHSSGGNWLADPNTAQPYGGLGAALKGVNYFVSATNYGWGPNSIGDRTDIINWPEWFTGANTAAITAALYAETDKNIEGFGDWTRLGSDPGGTNQIVMFKSCFPNSDLFGDPSDTAGTTPNDQYTVSNAKAVYNDILTYFTAHQEKLFIVVTAPPQIEGDYSADYQTAAHRAANARAFNNWLMNDWLDGYAHQNVGVFDYFNVLTGPNNHHRVNNGVVEHVTAGGSSDFAYYPSGDSHPGTTGHTKATSEFVDLLNYYYNRWISGDGGGDTGDDDDQDGDGDDDNDGGTSTGRLSTADFEYKGAFRLPDTCTEEWSYGGGALTCYPNGDASGTADGYPGSLFGAGYNVNSRISEISIPVPVISSAKAPEALNTAVTLQGFTNLMGPLSTTLDTPPLYAGLAWLPAQGSQTSGKLYLAFGQHFQEFNASHLWCETDLSRPALAGPWLFGGYPNYVTNDYLFPIPTSFASTCLNGRRLASGRHREGVWGGLGPALFAAAPWQDGNPPGTGTKLSTPLPLLLYGEAEDGVPEITTDESRQMAGYSQADYWSGGAWLTAGSESALAFIGTKATGDSWYGFANGVEWDYDCADTNSCPEVPDWPYDDRGYWADSYEARIALYDTDDIAAVARGTKNTWDPQPYATIDLTPYLFDSEIDVTRYRRHLVGAMAFDEVNGLLYFFELLVDGDKDLIHVFRIISSGSGDDDAGDDSQDDTGDDSNDGGGGTTNNGGETESGGSGGGGGGCYIDTLVR